MNDMYIITAIIGGEICVFPVWAISFGDAFRKALDNVGDAKLITNIDKIRKSS